MSAGEQSTSALKELPSAPLNLFEHDGQAVLSDKARKDWAVKKGRWIKGDTVEAER